VSCILNDAAEADVIVCFPLFGAPQHDGKCAASCNGSDAYVGALLIAFPTEADVSSM
jgi:hypothetical protein